MTFIYEELLKCFGNLPAVKSSIEK